MKYIVTIALMFVAIAQTQAQTQAQQGITIEAKGGINFAKAAVEFDGDTSYNKGITGYNLGFIVGFPFSEKFSFETGLMLSGKGALDEDEENGFVPVDGFDVKVSIEREVELLVNYLDIPLHIKGTFPINEGVSFFGIVGPTISFATGGQINATTTATASLQGESETESESESEDLEFGNSDTDNFKPLDFGLTFGVGLSFDNLSFGLNYDLGLANILTDDISKDGSWKNRVFSISVGYRL